MASVYATTGEDLPSEVHDKTWIPRFVHPLVSAATRLIAVVSGRAFDGLLAATQEIAECFPSGKTVVIQNFPIVDEFSRELGRDYSSRPPVVVYMGEIERLRGISEMVRAMELLPEHLGSRPSWQVCSAR